MADVANLDLGVFIAYIVLVMSIGFIAGRKKKQSAGDYFIASGKLPWFVVGFGLIATSISTEQMIGSSGATFKMGLVVFNWEICNYIGILSVIFIFLPVYLNRKVVTIPHYLELRFGDTPRLLYAIINIGIIIFILLAGVTYTGGFVLEQIFGINKNLCIWILIIISGSYTIYGGLISVAWTQVLQGILLLAGGFLISGLGIANVEGGFNAIIGTGERAHLIQPMSHPELPWTAILILTLHVDIWYFGTNQQLIQSGLGAKSRWHGMMGVLFAGFLILASAMVIEFPGLVAYALDPNLENTDSAFLFAAKSLIPVGLRGLVFAGLCGAIMSTIQGLTQAASTVFSLELFAKTFKGSSDKNLIKVGKIASAMILLFGGLWAPMVENWPNIFEFFTKCFYFISAPIASLFVWAVLWKRTTKTAVTWTLMLTFVFFFIPYLIKVVEQNYELKINEYNLAGICFIVSFAFTFIVSLLTEKPGKEQIEGLVWDRSMIKIPKIDNSPFYKSIWFWSGIYIAITIFIYAKFW